MDKEEIKNLASSKRFIAGIYNYCDRWCERCPFTSRCMNFAMGEEQFGDQESLDITNDLFWQKMTETLQVTLDLLKEMAEEKGIDLDSLEMDDTEEEEKLIEEATENHECCRAARAYADMVDRWFDSTEALFQKWKDGTDSETEINPPEAGPGEGSDSLNDSVQVVRWYQFQIWVKLVRAVRGAFHEDSDFEEEYQKDSDGSAKVALTGIDRSIAAWGEIRKHFLVQEKETIELLLHLEGLRKRVEEVFPMAREFIRPGFDEIVLDS